MREKSVEAKRVVVPDPSLDEVERRLRDVAGFAGIESFCTSDAHYCQAWNVKMDDGRGWDMMGFQKVLTDLGLMVFTAHPWDDGMLFEVRRVADVYDNAHYREGHSNTLGQAKAAGEVEDARF